MSFQHIISYMELYSNIRQKCFTVIFFFGGEELSLFPPPSHGPVVGPASPTSCYLLWKQGNREERRNLEVTLDKLCVPDTPLLFRSWCTCSWGWIATLLPSFLPSFLCGLQNNLPENLYPDALQLERNTSIATSVFEASIPTFRHAHESQFFQQI